jgi:hypothetical protein
VRGQGFIDNGLFWVCLCPRRLAYTGFHGGLEHLKIETRLRDKRFDSVMGECVI